MNKLDTEKKIVNVATLLKDSVKNQPYKRAVVQPCGIAGNGLINYSHLTFKQLDEESDCLARGFEEIGITRGVKTVLMVTPSIDFFVLTYALFKVGAVPVVVDPGMGLKRMLSCLEESQPEAFIGIPKAHVLRTLFRKPFKNVTIFVTVGKKYFWGGHTLEKLKKSQWKPFQIAETGQDETAAILFTTGSTGPAKGVVYTHGNFHGQIESIRAAFDIGKDEIDLPTFPLFALFDPALEMTAIIPDMDPTKPAFVNQTKIIEAINNQGVTNMFASPALLNRVGSYGKEKRIKLPSLKRVVSAGAPVSPANIEQFSAMFLKKSDTEIHTPYGATESVPILSIGSQEILSETRKFSEIGYGTCIGRPINNIEIRLIIINDEPIQHWSDDLIVKQGEVGEIVVKGPLVSRKYYKRPHDDDLSKIIDKESFYHRMGDLGWLDEKGRIWFCGRKSHRVTTFDGNMYSVCCESIFNNHEDVFRSALVGIGEKGTQEPVICIELNPGVESGKKEKILSELLEISNENEITKKIKTVLFHDSFPVDIRHNSKIFREKLAVWAEKKSY